MKTILVFGSFDIIHPGHEYFLTQARKLGDRLIVSLARDDFIMEVKKQKPYFSQNKRTAHLINSGLVDQVYLSDPVMGTYSIFENETVDTICLGYDQNALRENLKQTLKVRNLGITLIVIDAHHPQIHKSSFIKKRLEQKIREKK